MNFNADTWWIFGLIVTAIVAVIGFFLVRMINQVDKQGKDIVEIQKTYVTKEEFKDFKLDINKAINKIQTDIEQIKDNCLAKGDFYRSQMQTDKKIDKIYDLLIKKQTEGGGNDT